MNQILTLQIPLENLPFRKESEATLFIICWTVLVEGMYTIVNAES